jgi:hypothetical protein
VCTRVYTYGEALTLALIRPDLTRCAMNAELQSELNDLRFHWDEMYEIGYDETTRQWSARFKGADYEMIGRTGDELRHAIRLDYQERRREEQKGYVYLRERSST